MTVTITELKLTLPELKKLAEEIKQLNKTVDQDIIIILDKVTIPIHTKVMSVDEVEID